MRAPIPEFKNATITPGLTCSECGMSYVNADNLHRIKLADAELIFCKECGMALAAVQLEESRSLRKSA